MFYYIIIEVVIAKSYSSNLRDKVQNTKRRLT
jgi:hypothetical protein